MSVLENLFSKYENLNNNNPVFYIFTKYLFTTKCFLDTFDNPFVHFKDYLLYGNYVFDMNNIELTKVEDEDLEYFKETNIYTEISDDEFYKISSFFDSYLTLIQTLINFIYNNKECIYKDFDYFVDKFKQSSILNYNLSIIKAWAVIIDNEFPKLLSKNNDE